jgi:hypothetical protein
VARALSIASVMILIVSGGKKAFEKSFKESTSERIRKNEIEAMISAAR